MQKFSNYLLNNNVGLKEEINSKLINLMLCLNNKELKESITNEEYVYFTYTSNNLLTKYRDIITQEIINENKLDMLNSELAKLNNEVLECYEKINKGIGR